MQRLLVVLAVFTAASCGDPIDDALEQPDPEPVSVQAGALKSHSGQSSRDDRHGHHRDRCSDREIVKVLEEVSTSCCGFPRDRGNELGVGKFCLTDKQCKRNAGATLCSSIENEVADHRSYFCTMLCDPNSPVNICGAGAACNCEGDACACTPVSCLQNPPEGCEGP
jgi:hypothetical protein